MADLRGTDRDFGPRSVTTTEVETSFALPKTLQAETQIVPMNGAKVATYAVYGRDMNERRVWCCTFLDRDEATVWVQSSKMFGRPVSGAVIVEQKPEEAANDGTGTVSGEAAETPN